MTPAEAVRAAAAAGVERLVTIGCGERSSRRAIGFAEEFPEVSATVGMHPHDAKNFDESDLEWLTELSSHNEVVGIGECGLDYFYDHSPRDAQEAAFVAQIALARRAALPLIIHTRDAATDTLRLLAEHAEGVEVVLHCFSIPEHLDEVVERGYWTSFAGPVTFKGSDDLREAAARAPLERLLVETDSPYLAPSPMRGKPNEPAFVRFTLAAVARARGMDSEELDRVTSANAARLFGW